MSTAFQVYKRIFKTQCVKDTQACMFTLLQGTKNNVVIPKMFTCSLELLTSNKWPLNSTTSESFDSKKKKGDRENNILM